MAKTSDKPLADYEVLLCLTGSIACYKSADLAGRLIRNGAGVTAAMTDAAQRFICPLTFQSLTHRQVFADLWQSGENFRSRHISLTEAADLIIVAPATANIIAKMACGIADDLVSTMALAAHDACEVLVAPAMNSRMWSAPATQANMETLKGRGVHVVGPAEGALACRTDGLGRMAEPADILAAADEIARRKPPKKTAG
ncbi:MAG: flavoprotein [Planctomycetota bacterium]|nr:flavoprotein [Planctomycetota bacterium]